LRPPDPALQPKLFALVKMLGKVDNAKVIKEEKTAAGVTLTVEGVDPSDGKKQLAEPLDLLLALAADLQLVAGRQRACEGLDARHERIRTREGSLD
jgi:hypothetical protein